MKISPVNISPIKSINFGVKEAKKECCSNAIKNLSNIYYMPAFCGSDSEYKPISSKTPNYNLLNCDYSNLDEFSKLFTQKINSQLRIPEISDVKALINRIKLRTNADNKLIYDILYQLTQFSNYKTVDYLQQIADEYSIGTFGLQQKFMQQTQKDISSNAALNYLANNKEFIRGLKNEKSLIVLDNLFIDQLESSKKDNGPYYERFIEEMKRGRITLLNLRGWDVKCSDNKYRSAAFLYGTGNLEELAVDVIKRVQKGESADDILYSDIEKRLYDTVKDDLDINDIKINKYRFDNKKKINAADIYENLKMPEIQPEKIKASVKKIIDRYGEAEQTEYLKSILTKYLDEITIAYSFDTINYELSKIHETINTKHGDDVIYTIMEPNKSSNLISHLYAHTNSVSNDKFFGFSHDFNFLKTIKSGKYTTFVLDDISASGETIDKYCRRAKALTKYDIPLFNYALLTATNTAKEVYENCNYTLGYMLSQKSVNDIGRYFGDLLSIKECNYLRRMLNSGYLGIYLSAVYPYIIPDNCSDLSSGILNNILIKENERSNKALSYSIDNA